MKRIEMGDFVLFHAWDSYGLGRVRRVTTKRVYLDRDDEVHALIKRFRLFGSPYGTREEYVERPQVKKVDPSDACMEGIAQAEQNAQERRRYETERHQQEVKQIHEQRDGYIAEALRL